MINFYRQTKSFDLIVLLEKIKEYNFLNDKFKKIKYIILFLIKFKKFEIITNIKIRKKLKPKQRIELFLDLYKEYFYLQRVIRRRTIKKYSAFSYVQFAELIVSEISYNDIRLHVEYNFGNGESSIFIDDKKKKFNLSERSLTIVETSDIFNLVLKLISAEIFMILINLFTEYVKEDHYVQF